MNKEAIIQAQMIGNKFETFSDSQLETTLRWCINDAMKLRGQSNADESLMQTVVKKIAEVLTRDYPALTDKEFNLILEAGISGEFGKETWVSGAAIIQWLRAYKSDKAYIAVIDGQEEERKSKNKLSQGEIDTLNKIAFESSFLNAQAYFEEKGTIFQRVGEKPNDERAFHLPQWAAQVYKYYRDKGVIPAPTQEELTIAEEKASAEMAKGNTFRIKADILKVAREDWRDSFLLENYYRSLKK